MICLGDKFSRGPVFRERIDVMSSVLYKDPAGSGGEGGCEIGQMSVSSSNSAPPGFEPRHS